MSRKVIVNGESICYLPPVDASEIRYDLGSGNYSNVQTKLEAALTATLPTNSYYVYSFKKVKSNY